jgi:hypothetical protein
MCQYRVPSSREVFSAEGAKDEAFDTWERQLARVLPECGCAADNVATAPATVCVDLLAARVRCWPLAGSGGSVQLLDSFKRPSGETNVEIAASAPFVECRTLFYGPDDGSGAWPGGSAPMIVDRSSSSGSSSSAVPATRKRVSVEIKFDAKFAQVRSLCCHLCVCVFFL